MRPEWELKSDFTIPGGYAAARQLLEGADRPTGIVAASDEMAIGAILAARDLGLDVPRDVSVVGLDDHPDAPVAEGDQVLDEALRACGAFAEHDVGVYVAHGPVEKDEGHAEPRQTP